MKIFCNLYWFFHRLIFEHTRALDGIPILLLRLYLAPVFIIAGWTKLEHLESTVQWFDKGLGLPEPELMATLAISAELGGGLALLIGFAVRWVSIPLIATMLVAIFSVHLPYGWFAIAPGSPANSPARAVAALGVPMAEASLREAAKTQKILSEARALIDKSPNAKNLKSKGPLVILQNGIEFAFTYLIMLMVLFFSGGGRYVSLDYLIAKRCRPSPTAPPNGY